MMDTSFPKDQVSTKADQLHLVEIKSWNGVISGDPNTWRREADGKEFLVDSPLLLANRKAKKLIGLLKTQKALARQRRPYVEAAVFLSRVGVRCRLEGRARTGVYLSAESERSNHPNIIHLLDGNAGFDPRRPPQRIDQSLSRAFARAVEQAGIRPSQRQRRVADYVLRSLLLETDAFQDWEAEHVSVPGSKRRVRIYPLARTSSEAVRAEGRRAAEREYQLLDGITHDGILRVESLTSAEQGPALVFEHDPGAERLDHFLERRNARGLDLPTRLDLLRQLAETLKYAHERRLYHRALTPQKVLVIDANAERPRLKIFDWRAGEHSAPLGSNTSGSRGSGVLSTLGLSGDDEGDVYLAPETAHGHFIAEKLDIFSLGAIGYRLFSGQPPASTVAALNARLASAGGLRLSDAVDGLPGSLQLVVETATDPEVGKRPNSVSEFLDLLVEAERELADVREEQEAVVHPLDAVPGDMLEHGFRVEQRLGKGSTAVALKVACNKGGDEGSGVLKVALDPSLNERIRREGEVLGLLRHPNIVSFRRCVELSGHAALFISIAGTENKTGTYTLADRIREEGRFSLDLLQRFGGQLLNVVQWLEEKGISHRDLKPDNIGVSASAADKSLALVVFDFSLADTPAENIRAGTPQYLDPFLQLRKPPRWDVYAERFAAAMTLHEMATGNLPRWGDGSTDPLLVGEEVTVDAEWFDPSVRDPLAEFFARALARDYRSRFDSAEDMGRAWSGCFEAIDMQTAVDEEGHDLPGELDGVTRETPLLALGLSPRLLNALDRLGAHTVAQLVDLPRIRLYRNKGIGQRIVKLIRELSERLAEYLAEHGQTLDTTTTVHSDDHPVDPAVWSIDLLASKLVSTHIPDEEARVVRTVLGIEGGLSLLPAHRRVAESLGAAPTGIAGAIRRARDRWAKHGWMAPLRDSVAALVLKYGGIMTARELAQALAATRGSTETGEVRLRRASAVAAAALEMESAREPGTPERVLVQRALDGVHGVDLNPFAVAIARFRPLVAALRASRIERLRGAPDFRMNVAAGDSLLHGRRFDELDLGSGADQLTGREAFGHAFQAEDLDDLNRILGRQYHVVVGNPPYVTVKERAVNRLYRERYGTCHRQYLLAVPFTERFFGLALPGTGATGLPNPGAGYVGLITANSFMKREFGKKLIESFFPTVDLTRVIDTSGAYIPGHGTPTVILFGRHRTPAGDVVRTVMGIRGEPATPENPAMGRVWSAIVEQVDIGNSESDWVSTDDAARMTFARHPWSISGGGANALMEHLEAHGVNVLKDEIHEIGYGALTREDEVYLISREVARRLGIEPEFVKPLVAGDMARNWAVVEPIGALWPYEETSLEASGSDAALKFLWNYRRQLRERIAYGQSLIERGLAWYEYSMFFRNRYRVSLAITFAEVATHNHFVLDRGGKVFKQTAPVIKLPADATEADHLALLGVLNSSVAYFWMKQVFHNKGSTVDAHGARQTTDALENFYQYAGTGLKKFPLPANRPTTLAQALDRLATERQIHLPTQLAEHFPLAPAELDARRDEAATLLARMIALQEELDWECYRLYGVIDEDCRYAGDEPLSTEGPPGSQRVHADQCSDDGVPGSAGILPAAGRRPAIVQAGKMPALPGGASPNMLSRQASGVSLRQADETNHNAEQSWHPGPPAGDDHRNPNDAVAHCEPPPLALGERAFEIVMARRMTAGELETTWFARHGTTPITEPPAHWPDDYRALVERPEYKRRWNVESWHDQEQRALRRWLLDRLESPAYWPEVRLATVRALAERAATDADFQQVATRYAGHAGVDLDSLVEALVGSESVPALPVLRYRPSGLAKRTDWERTWARQRHEDRIDVQVASMTPRREDETEERYAARLEAARRHRKREEVGEHPPPPKYRSADFLEPAFWRLRGALDVPKERFVGFPTMSRDSDPTLLVGWAGWTVLEFCQAVATYAAEVTEQGGWPPQRLTPLLAALQENLPWLKQWHNEVDPEYKQRLGDFFETWLHSQLSIHGLIEHDLRAWTPPEIDRRRRTKRRRGSTDRSTVPDRSAQSVG